MVEMRRVQLLTKKVVAQLSYYDIGFCDVINIFISSLRSFSSLVLLKYILHVQ